MRMRIWHEASQIAAALIIASTLSGCSSAGWIAAQKGDSVQLQQILKQTKPSESDFDDYLFAAIRWPGCYQCVQELLDAGAKPRYAYLAAARGHERIARLLLSRGGDRMSDSEDVYTPEQRQAAAALYERLDAEATGVHVAAPVATAVPSESEPSFPVHPQLVPSFREPEHPDDYALVVGIEHYDSLPPASYAGGDAAVAADFFRALGVPARNVVTLTDAHATRSGMVKQLENWLVKNTDRTSTVYFYFSGHGAPDPTTGQAYLVPFDGDPQYLAETAYPMKRLYEKLGALKAKRTIVMIDSCFSGAGGRSVLAKGTRPLVSTVDVGAADSNIAVLTASGANQVSSSYDEKGHGLFTYYLFNGLNGAAKDDAGRITLQSLYNYLRPRVMDDARRANGDQTPEMKADSASSSLVLREK